MYKAQGDWNELAGNDDSNADLSLTLSITIQKGEDELLLRVLEMFWLAGYVFDSSVSAAEDDQRPSILQMNIEWLTVSKISVIEQLASPIKALVPVLQETHCTTADKLAIPIFSLAGSVLSRKHGLATFVHERLESSQIDQPPEQSETEWLCVDIAGYKIINICKLLPSRLTPITVLTFRHPRLYAGDSNAYIG